MPHAVRTVAVASIIYLAMSVVRPVAARTQAATAAAPAEILVIAGDVAQALTVTPADLKAMPRKPLFDYQGPFRIVAPHDKRGARSIRMLQRLEVVRLVK
jgi:hypothetical protein